MRIGFALPQVGSVVGPKTLVTAYPGKITLTALQVRIKKLGVFPLR
jgi:hypothetical protein